MLQSAPRQPCRPTHRSLVSPTQSIRDIPHSDNIHSILYTYWAPYVTLVSVYQANIAGHTKKVTLYAWFFVGWATGNIIGPQTFREEQAPAYTGGTTAMIVCYLVAMACVLTYGVICTFENRRRAKDADEQVAATQDWLDLTDKEYKGFKYTT